MLTGNLLAATGDTCVRNRTLATTWIRVRKTLFINSVANISKNLVVTDSVAVALNLEVGRGDLDLVLGELAFTIELKAKLSKIYP